MVKVSVRRCLFNYLCMEGVSSVNGIFRTETFRCLEVSLHLSGFLNAKLVKE